MKLKAALFCSVAALATAGVSAAEPTPAERAVGYRKGVFHAIAWNFGPMAGMVKNEIPFDADNFALRAQRVAFLSTLPLEGFIPDSRVGNTDAKPAVWEDMDEFKSMMQTFETEAGKLAEVAKDATEVAAVRPQFAQVGQACKDCHDKFKED